MGRIAGPLRVSTPPRNARPLCPRRTADRALAAAAVAATIAATGRVGGVVAPAPPRLMIAAPAARVPERQDPRHSSARPATRALRPVDAPGLTLARPPAPGTPAGEVTNAVRQLIASEGERHDLQVALGRMAAYAPLVEAALREHRVPRELVYLAIVESAYRPGAVSRAGAAGLWQFMRGTGALYGLEVSAYVDERRDPVRSTSAAARHLDELHREFGSWHLALAAYNAGSARVWRALRSAPPYARGDERAYWGVRHSLPAETRAYVPRFLAAAAIGRDPAAFGVRPRPEPPLAFREVWCPGGTSLTAFARARGMAPGAVLDLNPHLIRGITPPGRSWPVRVPVGTARGREGG